MVVTDPQRDTQTNPQTDRLQYTSPLSLARSVTNSVNYEEHRKSIEVVANYAAPLIGRVDYKEMKLSDGCLSSVYLSRTSGLGRAQRRLIRLKLEQT